MADSHEPDADGAPEADAPAEPVAPDAADSPVSGPARAPKGRGIAGFDGRTIGIAAVLGIAAAIVTVLIATAFTSSDGTSSEGVVQLQDTDALLKEPIETADGATTDLADFQDDGQPMLVNFWQAACEPCVTEMPMIDAAQADHPHVTFVGINSQESAAKASKMAKQTGITYSWALDPDGELWYATGGQTMPHTVLLDATGAVIATKSGKFKNADDLRAFLDLAS